MGKVQVRVAAAIAAIALAVVPATAAQAAGKTAAASVLARIGSRGPLVREVERIVHVRVDGVYGRGTARAVAAWQRAHHLPATGVVDQVTWARMHPARTAPRPKPQPTTLPYIAPTVTYTGMSCLKSAMGTTMVWHWKLTGGQYSLLKAVDPSGLGLATTIRVYGTTLTQTTATDTNWDGVSDWGSTETPFYGFWTEPIGQEDNLAVGHALQGTAAPVVPKC